MLHVDLIAPIATLLDRHAKKRPDQIAYWDTTRSVTYAQLAERTASIAANLTKAGLEEGDELAMYLPNGVDWIEICLAALRAGAVVVPISIDAAEGEISYRLTDAGCTLIVTMAARKTWSERSAAMPALRRRRFSSVRTLNRPGPRRRSSRTAARQRRSTRTTSIGLRSSSTPRAPREGRRGCCCRCAVCCGSPPPAGRRSEA